AICQDSADIVWTGTVNSNQLVTTFSDTTIYIADSLVVSDTLRFLQCELIMAAGSSINVVGASGMLILEETQVYGCDTMWQGINVSQQSQLRISESSLVADANIAVTARHKSVISIIHSNLMDNARNVFIPVTSGVTTNDVSLTMFGDSIGVLKNQFLPRYNGQAVFGSIPISGVETNRWVGTIGTTGLEKNVFFNMMRGVVGKVSFVRCENNDFIDMLKDPTAPTSTSDHGKGINVISESSQVASSLHVTANNYFFNNIYGIYTAKSKTTVRGVLMDTVRYGVHVRNCIDTLTSEISSNTINAFFRGIDLMNNAGSDGISVRNNTLNIDSGASAARGISMTETVFGNGNYKIEDNILTLNGADHGIFANAVAAPIITGNTIYQNPLSVPNTSVGIAINGCDSAIVSCNTVISTYNMAQNLATGLRVDISDICNVFCNSTEGHHRGIFFGGTNAGTSFKGNTMGTHYVGLYLNDVAVIDQQPSGSSSPFHGNIWQDSASYSSGYGAVNLNDSNIVNLQASLFSTNQSIAAHNPVIPINFATPFLVDDQGWFDPQNSGSSFSCSSSLSCEDTTNGGGEHLRMQIASDQSLTSDFIPESKYIAKQALFDEIKKDVTGSFDTPLFNSFEIDAENSSIGKLHETKLLFGTLNVLDAVKKSEIRIAISEIQSIADSIVLIDSLLAYQYSSTLLEIRSDLIESISLIHDDIATIEATRQASNATILNDLAAAITNITPSETPDATEKAVYDLEVLYHQEGISALINHFNSLLQLAVLCPYSGGKAVFRARNLIWMLDETLTFNDEAACQAVGIFKESQSQANLIKNPSISLQPNPANETVNIVFGEMELGSSQITIKDITGRIVFDQVINNSSLSLEINISHFDQGIYVVEWKFSGQKPQTEKLAIIR
ncbi:MAG: T9SS type A sorting domain-containing protein, partial [Bacteroidia bacterium]|nr:T9SS type A sorting domain-containing protein [Bacteroidia bacterium]